MGRFGSGVAFGEMRKGWVKRGRALRQAWRAVMMGLDGATRRGLRVSRVQWFVCLMKEVWIKRGRGTETEENNGVFYSVLWKVGRKWGLSRSWCNLFTLAFSRCSLFLAIEYGCGDLYEGRRAYACSPGEYRHGVFLLRQCSERSRHSFAE